MPLPFFYATTGVFLRKTPLNILIAASSLTFYIIESGT